MRSKIRSVALVAACAAASLAASQCASPNNGGARQAARSEAPAVAHLEPANVTPQSTAEQIAAWADAGCKGSERASCLEKALTSVIRPAGVDKAMGALALIAARDDAVRGDGHVFAHGIGIAAYESAETVGQTFSKCTAEFQSGCYHGVIQAYFADRRGGDAGVTPAKLNGLCTAYRTVAGRWLQFQCAHGIGHGLMAVQSHNLLRALDSCDLLADAFERDACWGGAFMENVVNATSPHHMSTTRVADVGAAGGEHAGHDMAGMNHEGMDMSTHHDSAGGHEGHEGMNHEGMSHDSAGHAGMAGMEHSHGESTFKALDTEEPLYPCTIVKEQHRHACYLMQTSSILYFNHGDFADAAKQCARAPSAHQNTCYVSLGRDANSWGRGSRERASAFCQQAPETAQPFCYIGLVKNIVDVTSDARDGLSFCRMVPDASKPACYVAAGQQVGLLSPTPDGREASCRGAEAGYVAECRRGAGLPLVPTQAPAK